MISPKLWNIGEESKTFDFEKWIKNKIFVCTMNFLSKLNFQTWFPQKYHMEQNLFHISYSFLIHLFLTISPKYSSFRFKIFKNYLKKSFHSIIYNSTISQILIRLLINKLLLFLPFPLPPILTSILSKFSFEIYFHDAAGKSAHLVRCQSLIITGSLSRWITRFGLGQGSYTQEVFNLAYLSSPRRSCNSLVSVQGKGNMETYWLSDKVEATQVKLMEEQAVRPEGLLVTDI